MHLSNVRGAGRLLAVGVALTTLAACGLADPEGGSNADSPNVSTSTAVSSSTEILSIAWGDAGLVVGVDDPSWDLSLARVNLDDGSLALIETPTESHTCEYFNYLNPMPLDDAHVAALVDCVKRTTLFSVAKLVAVNVRSGQTRPLFDLGWNAIALRDFGLTPDRATAVASEGSLICNSLAEISNAGWSRPKVEPPELVPIQGQRGLEVDSNVGDCDGLARVGTPDISVDGTLAFVSYKPAAEASGIDRFEGPGTLYLLPEGTQKAEELLSDVTPATVRWSPDGSTLALVGTVEGVQGVFLVDASTGSISRISGDAYIALSWSSDGRSLAAVREGGDTDDVKSIIDILVP